LNRSPSSDAVLRDLAEVTGLVIGRNGKGGSGTCVQLEDGTVALLTAKHVVIECIRNTGGIAIAAPFSGINFQFPRLIRMDSSQQGDAALVVFKEVPQEMPAIPFSQWTINHSKIAVGMPVFACGFPGALRKMEDSKIKPQFSFVGDWISSINGHMVTTGINETIADMPSNFRGLSGGGLFAEDGSFLGLIVEERRRITPSRGELYSILPSGFTELYKPYSMPPDAPNGGDYAERRSVALNLLKPNNEDLVATIGVLAELFWSKSDPNHKLGRIGRIINLEFILPGVETHFPINVESLFTWDEDTEESRLSAIHDEFKFLLLRIGWLLKDDGETLELQVNPMI
jgi:hypothetical protein